MYDNELTTLQLPCKSVFYWPYFLQFQEKRLIDNMEFIDGNTYGRTVTLHGVNGYFNITPAGDGFIVAFTRNLIVYQAELIEKITKMFDLATDTAAIEAHLRNCYPRLPIRPGLHIPGVFCPFEAGIRAICGQRISVVAATKLVNKLVKAFATTDERCRLYFPRPESFNTSQLAGIAMMRDKRTTLMEFAQWWLDHPQPDLQQLLEIKGIGIWTLDYIRLRACNDDDIWMGSDLGIRQSIQKLGSIDENKAAPFRSYLTLQLWNMYSAS